MDFYRPSTYKEALNLMTKFNILTSKYSVASPGIGPDRSICIVGGVKWSSGTNVSSPETSCFCRLNSTESTNPIFLNEEDKSCYIYI